MAKHKLPHKTKPCSNCPFRKDCRKGWLGEERIIEILNAPNFVCHKTTGDKKKRLQCAGHMLLLKNDNDFYRLANRMHLPLRVSGEGLVFSNKSECINHHK